MDKHFKENIGQGRAVSGVLGRILVDKRLEVGKLKSRRELKSLRQEARDAPSPMDLVAALRSCPHIPIIAEIKRASPSAGSLKTGVNVAELARSYARGGASALSVLTDGPYFGGALADLKETKAAVSLPILRKDFIIDPIQIYESRIAGADAVLLIAAALSRPELEALFLEARNLGMTPLVEVHGEEELNPVLALNPPIVGVNNRDLSTLKVSLETCVRLRPLIPPDVLVVGESGIQGPEDVKRLRNAGLDAFLIGTTLMRAKDPQAELARMCGLGRTA